MERVCLLRVVGWVVGAEGGVGRILLVRTQEGDLGRSLWNLMNPRLYSK